MNASATPTPPTAEPVRDRTDMPDDQRFHASDGLSIDQFNAWLTERGCPPNRIRAKGISVRVDHQGGGVYFQVECFVRDEAGRPVIVDDGVLTETVVWPVPVAFTPVEERFEVTDEGRQAAADGSHLPEIEQIGDRPIVPVLLHIIRDLCDTEPCSLDHHGYCQAHGWLTDGECPHARAKVVLDIAGVGA